MSDVVRATLMTLIPNTGLIDTSRSRRRVPLLIVLALFIVALVTVCAILGAALAPYAPETQRLLVGDKPPSAAFWAGTDLLGRDVLSRVIFGSRTALIGPIVVAVSGFAIATLLGFARWISRRGGRFRHHALGRFHVCAARPAGRHRRGGHHRRRLLDCGRRADRA